MPHLRLACILLDSVTELILHRTVQAELWDQELLAGLLAKCRPLAADGHEEAAAEILSIEARVISKSKLRDIDRNFDAKVAFLADREVLDPTLCPVLEKLHKYRNEMYHRDKLRREVPDPATLIYFDSACTALEAYKPPMMALTGNTLGSELSRFTGGGLAFLGMGPPAADRRAAPARSGPRPVSSPQRSSPVPSKRPSPQSSPTTDWINGYPDAFETCGFGHLCGLLPKQAGVLVGPWTVTST